MSVSEVDVERLVAVVAGLFTIIAAAAGFTRFLWPRLVAWKNRPRAEKELGYNDLERLHRKQMEAARKVQIAMTRDTTRHTERLGRYTELFVKADRAGRAWQKSLIGRLVALRTTRYAGRMRRDIHRHSLHFRAAQRSLIRAGGISSQILPGDHPAFRARMNSMEEMERALGGNFEAAINHRAAVERSPRMTTTQARARAALLDDIDEVIQERRADILLTRETRMALERMHRRSG